MSINSEWRDRLLTMADDLAAQAYRKDGTQRRGQKALKAALDLEALQFACLLVRSEVERDGLHNITPLETPFTQSLTRWARQ